MAILYKTDGTQTEVLPRNGESFTLEELQGFVGGWIQIVSAAKNIHIICNEEGKLIGLPRNVLATPIWIQYFGYTDTLCGDVLIANDAELDLEGDDLED